MIAPKTSISIPVNLTNPGQFFACCGLLELADRLWPGAEGWFEGRSFKIAGELSLESIWETLKQFVVSNTMTPAQILRLQELSEMKKAQRSIDLEAEKKSLESLRRELPITFNGDFRLRIDWFCDDFAGGPRLKTWAGQQSVLDIAKAMHGGLVTGADLADKLWSPICDIGLPFNFDSDLGAQGSALDIGFSFDPLAGSETTRIKGTCKPALELLCFIGLQRFRPREITGQNRFVYVAWKHHLCPCVASAAVCQAISMPGHAYEFPLLYRTKYLKSFLPAQLFQGERDE